MHRVTVGYQDGCLHPLWITRAGMRVARALGASAIWVPDHIMGFAPKWMWTPDVVPAARVLHSMDALFDPVPIMTLAALKHRNVWIGTSVTEPIRRHPMSLAQTFVTLDHISKGRAILGIGNGLRENTEPYGLDYTGMGIDNAVFTTIDDAHVMADESGEKAVQKLNIPPGMVSAVLVKVEPGTSVDEVADEITRQVPGTKTIVPNGLLHAIGGQLGAVTRLLYGSTLAVIIVAIPLLGTVSAMVAHERRREISLLRALGATKGFVVRLILAESFSLAIIGAFLGIAVSAGFLILYQDFIKITMCCSSSPEAQLAKHVKRGDEYVKERKFPEAVIEYRNAVKAVPNDASAHWKLAQAALEARDIRTAGFQELLKTVELAPDNFEALGKLGEIYLLSGKTEEAAQIADKLVESRPQDPHGYLLQSGIAVRAGKIDDGIALLRKASGLDPKRVRTMLAIGNLYLMKRDRAGAMEWYDKALSVDPGSVDVHVTRGNYFFSSGERDEGEKEYRRASGSGNCGSGRALRDPC